jgi:hypothetical protein
MAITARRISLAVVLVIGSAFVLCSPLSSVSANSCAALRAWAQPLAETVPTLDDMAGYDRAHRRALFNVLAPDVKAALWREQITRFSERPELTPTQRALAREGVSLHTAALYEREPAARQAHAAFWQRAAAAFADPLSQRAWTDLGTSFTAPAPARTAQNYCDCKMGGGTGQCGGVSRGNPAGCTAVSGCGVSGTETCNGMCQF